MQHQGSITISFQRHYPPTATVDDPEYRRVDEQLTSATANPQQREEMASRAFDKLTPLQHIDRCASCGELALEKEKKRTIELVPLTSPGMYIFHLTPNECQVHDALPAEYRAARSITPLHGPRRFYLIDEYLVYDGGPPLISLPAEQVADAL